MNIVEFLESTKNTRTIELVDSHEVIIVTVPRPRIVCNDGFSMSVQASSTAYCSPRTNHGPYDRVEIGYPSHIEPLLFYLAEDNSDYLNTVYPYISIDRVQAIIDKHGGFKELDYSNTSYY